jgi:hypothetical protein
MQQQTLSAAKRKRLLKTYGPCPTGYTTQDLERFLDLLYGMYSHVYTLADLRQMVSVIPLIVQPPRASSNSSTWQIGWKRWFPDPLCFDQISLALPYKKTFSR